MLVNVNEYWDEVIERAQLLKRIYEALSNRKKRGYTKELSIDEMESFVKEIMKGIRESTQSKA